MSKPPKIVQVPDLPEDIELDGLTRGKKYSVTEVEGENSKEFGYGFHMINDNGEAIFTLEKKTSHLNERNWIVIEREGDEPKKMNEKRLRVGRSTGKSILDSNSKLVAMCATEEIAKMFVALYNAFESVLEQRTNSQD